MQPRHGHPRDNDRFDTLAIHAGQEPDPTTGAIMTPVYFTSTYVAERAGRAQGLRVLAHPATPPAIALQGCLAALEGGKHGAWPSRRGLAATDALLAPARRRATTWSLGDDLYGGTFRLFDKVFKRLGIEFTFVDLSDAGDRRGGDAARRPSWCWVETPTNPMLKLSTSRALAEVCQEARAALRRATTPS